MIDTKKHTLIWFVLGCIFSLLVLGTVAGGLSGRVLVSDPEVIPEAADSVMRCIHTGDWNSLGQRISGSPSFLPETGKEASAEKIIWQAYQESLRWNCREEFSVQGACVSQPVSVTCLDITGVTDAMSEIVNDADTRNPENKEKLLRDAAEQVLNRDVPIMEREIQLTFQRKNGQWLLIPDSSFQALLSGFAARK